MAKPAGNLPLWGTLAAALTEPILATKQAGWLAGAGNKPRASYFNWWMNKVYEWVAYLDGLEAEALTWTAQQTMQALLQLTRSDELTPHIQVGTAAPTVMRLMLKAPLAGGRYLRLYANLVGELTMTINAEYRTSPAPGWYADITATAATYAFGDTYSGTFRASGTANTIITFTNVSANATVNTAGALQTGWAVSGGETPAYHVDATGMLHVDKGKLAYATGGPSLAITNFVPSGMRPEVDIVQPIAVSPSSSAAAVWGMVTAADGHLFVLHSGGLVNSSVYYLHNLHWRIAG